MKPVIQYELESCRAAFNLMVEEQADPVRLMHEELASNQARLQAEEFERKYQRQLSECPGFTTCDAPRGPDVVGRVVIEPGMIEQAIPWLKRRFHIAETLELSTDLGLCVEVKPRIKSVTNKSRAKVSFKKPEQFILEL